MEGRYTWSDAFVSHPGVGKEQSIVNLPSSTEALKEGFDFQICPLTRTISSH